MILLIDFDLNQSPADAQCADLETRYRNAYNTIVVREWSFVTLTAEQERVFRLIPGLEQAEFVRFGQMHRNTFINAPLLLEPTMAFRSRLGLFFAGQINGTTGYEEAAAQGLIAGLNAARQVQGRAPWTPRRDEAYIGVLIDDLITRGTSEPYRMFTSRAEYRLLLREDNADLRLTEQGRELGLVNETRWRAFSEKRTAIEKEQQRLQGLLVRPGTAVDALLEKPLAREARVHDLLRRPGIRYRDLMQIEGIGPGVEDTLVAGQIEVQAKYAGYVDRQHAEIERHKRYQSQALPPDLDYNAIRGLSSEVCEKLQTVRPGTIGQAARIPGMTPAAVSLLLIHLKKTGSMERKRA